MRQITLDSLRSPELPANVWIPTALRLERRQALNRHKFADRLGKGSNIETVPMCDGTDTVFKYEIRPGMFRRCLDPDEHLVIDKPRGWSTVIYSPRIWITLIFIIVVGVMS